MSYVDDVFERPHGPCQNCGDREATETFVEEGGVMAWNHGAFAYWCMLCVLKKQLEHAEERAREVPRLRREIQEFLDEEGNKGQEECVFSKAWVGKCRKPAINGLCEEHAGEKCRCGAQAYRTCDATIGAFVCGRPLCGRCGCH